VDLIDVEHCDCAHVCSSTNEEDFVVFASGRKLSVLPVRLSPMLMISSHAGRAALTKNTTVVAEHERAARHLLDAESRRINRGGHKKNNPNDPFANPCRFVMLNAVPDSGVLRATTPQANALRPTVQPWRHVTDKIKNSTKAGAATRLSKSSSRSAVVRPQPAAIVSAGTHRFSAAVRLPVRSTTALSFPDAVLKPVGSMGYR
jgi:hypothetical protein